MIIMDENGADLDFGSLGGGFFLDGSFLNGSFFDGGFFHGSFFLDLLGATGDQREDHQKSQQQSKQFLHSFFLLKIFVHIM